MLSLKHKSFLPHIVQPSCLSLILTCIYCFLSSVRLLYLVLYLLCPLSCQYSCFVVYPSLIQAFCVFAVHTGNPSLPSSSKGAEKKQKKQTYKLSEGPQRGEETDERDEKENRFEFLTIEKKKNVSQNSLQKMPVLTTTLVRQESIAGRTRFNIGEAILTSLSLSKKSRPCNPR